MQKKLNSATSRFSMGEPPWLFWETRGRVHGKEFRRSAPKAHDRYTTDPDAYSEFFEGLHASYSEDLESLNKAIA